MRIVTELREIKRIEKELNKMKSKKIIVGVISEEMIDEASVLDYATWNEYGTSKIPARPFFRTAAKTPQSQKEIKKYINSEIEKVIKGGKTGDKALNAIGTYVKGRIIKSLKRGNWIPNAQATIAKKLKENGIHKSPLIDTGTLIKSIDYEIKSR